MPGHFSAPMPSRHRVRRPHFQAKPSVAKKVLLPAPEIVQQRGRVSGQKCL